MRIYKEGQGKWARGLLVFTIVVGALFALSQLHGALPRKPEWAVLGVDWRYAIHAPLILLAAWFSLRLFNRPQTADFLIETENELKNKVTWPSRKEEVNASIVVVVTVLILSAFIFAADNGLKLLSETVIYPIPSEDCTNGVDDDYDGKIDAEDRDCASAPSPAAPAAE